MADEGGPLTVRVLTPAGPVFEGSGTIVFAPSAAGEVGVLSRHEPMVCTLDYGRTRVQDADGEQAVFATSEGFLTVERDEVLVLVEQAIPADQIDPARAQADLRAAEEALEVVGEDTVARENAEAEKRRAENLLKVLEEHK